MVPRSLDIPMRHRELFTKVRALVVNNPAAFLRAGGVLDRYWSYEAIKRREQKLDDSLLYLDPKHPVDERLPRARARHESYIASQLQIPGYENAKVVETQEASRPFACLHEFMQTYIQNARRRVGPNDYRLLPRKKALLHAEMILLVSWLATDSFAHERRVDITTLEDSEYEADTYMGRSWLGFLVLEHSKEHRDAWSSIVKAALCFAEPILRGGGWSPESIAEQLSREDKLKLLSLVLAEFRGTPATASLAGADLAIQSCEATKEVSESGAAGPGEPDGKHNEFVRRGEIWKLTFDGKTVEMRGVKGFASIQELIRQSGRTVEATDLSLISGAPGEGAPASGLDARSATFVPLYAQRGEGLVDSKGVYVLEKRAMDLQESLDKARKEGDQDEADRILKQMRALADETQRLVGPGGRLNRMRDDAERTRQKVGKGMNYALKKIRREHPALARHLKSSLREMWGSTPSYKPREEMHWHL